MALIILSAGVVAPPAFAEGSDAPGADAVLAAMFGGPQSGSWLTTKLPANATLAADQTGVAYVATVAPTSRWINGVSNNEWTSTINVVPDGTPLVPVVPKGNATKDYAGNLRTMFAAGVPLPAGLEPSLDYDAEIVVIEGGWAKTLAGRVYAGRMYELYGATHVAGTWAAAWGGRYVDTRNHLGGHWYDKWWTPPAGYDSAPWGANGLGMDHNWGAQATSIPLSHTIITRRDVRRGVIDHPVGLLLPPVAQAMQAGNVWPAQRWDPGSRKSMPEGTRLRLPSGYAVPASHPALTKMVEAAARDYGFVFADTVGAGTGPTVRMEPGAAALVPGGVNIGQVMNAFPWSALQVLAVGSDSLQTPTDG